MTDAERKDLWENQLPQLMRDLAAATGNTFSED